MAISTEAFCLAYRARPAEALSSLAELDDEEVAAILIDAGKILSERSLLDDGIARLENLQRSEPASAFRSYCIANGKHWRASLERDAGSSIDDSVLDDLFEARREHGTVLSDERVDPRLRSRSSTNFGNALLETGRWVEALDFFHKGQRIWPRNGVAALREMQCLMGFHNAASRDPARFGSYADIDRLYQRIVALSKVVEDTYAEIDQLAGQQAVDYARHAVLQIKPLSSGIERPRGDPFIEFIDSGSLALSLFLSFNQDKNTKIDTVSFERIIDDDWKSASVPEIFAMLNVMKADYALARQLFYEARFDDGATIFRETVKSSDTLDYSIYGVQASAMCSAQRIAYDILDKIAVALCGHLKMKNAKRATFDGFWYKKDECGNKFCLHEKIKNEITRGNRGLLALYDLHRDTTKNVPEKAGFLRALKDYRNSSTHRFTVLHDEYFGMDRARGKLVDHEHLNKFEDLTLSSIKLARAALFYFCDTINYKEDRRSSFERSINLTHEVPDHDYIRGRDFNE